MRKINFIDIDETLFFTKAKILVLKEGKVIKELSNQVFNNYKLEEGESFDFSQFRCSKTFVSTSIPNYKMIKKVNELEKKNEEIVLLTARADFDDKKKIIKYMNSVGLNVGHYLDKKIHIVRCGNEDGDTPSKKKDLIQRILKKRPEFDCFTLYDDSIKNLEKVSSIKKKNQMFLVNKENVKKVNKF